MRLTVICGRSSALALLARLCLLVGAVHGGGVLALAFRRHRGDNVCRVVKVVNCPVDAAQELRVRR